MPGRNAEQPPGPKREAPEPQYQTKEIAVTKKDYEAVAKVIKARIETDWFENGHRLDRPTLEVVANDLAALYQAGNSRFNRTKFLTACGF